jgi:hypothetical protein
MSSLLPFVRGIDTSSFRRSQRIQRDSNTPHRSTKNILGVGCDVEDVVDIDAGDISATMAMRQFLRSSLAFRIGADGLVLFVEAIGQGQDRVAQIPR